MVAVMEFPTTVMGKNLVKTALEDRSGKLSGLSKTAMAILPLRFPIFENFS
jgi:hypothetical protein